MRGYISVLRTAYGAYVEVRDARNLLLAHRRHDSIGEAENDARFLSEQPRYAGFTLEPGHIITANRRALGGHTR